MVGEIMHTWRRKAMDAAIAAVGNLATECWPNSVGHEAVMKVAKEITDLDIPTMLRCGKYELRQGPDNTLICHDTADEIDFVLTEVNIGAFMMAGLMLLERAPPTR